MMLQKTCLLTCFLILYIQHTSRGTPLTGKVRQAKKNEFPFVVSLSWNNPEKIQNEEMNHICGGTLITAKHVLTAAHCFKQLEIPEEIIIKVGDRDLVQSKKYEVSKWTTFDQWAKNEVANEIINDIAIVELTRCVSSSTKPAILTNSSEAVLYGKKAMVAGWGLIENNARPRYLMTGEVQVLKARECYRNMKRDMIGQMNSATHTFMCSSAFPPVFVECGDSGGPLFLEPNELIAINKGYCTFGKDKPPSCSRQNSHISIDHYRQFITEHIKCKDRGSCCIIQ